MPLQVRELSCDHLLHAPQPRRARLGDGAPHNPAAGGDVVTPIDPRALHMFDFAASGQEVVNAGAYQVFVSFDYAY